MSLALWEFFWDWDTPAPTPAPTSPPGVPTPLPGPPEDGGSGHGHGRGHSKGPKNSKLDLADWDSMGTIRESYLKDLYPEVPAAPKPGVADYNSEANRRYEAAKKQLAEWNAERASIVQQLRNAPDLATMKRLGSKIKELNAKIASLMTKQAVARFLK